MYKKLMIAVLAALLLLSVSACAKQQSANGGDAADTTTKAQDADFDWTQGVAPTLSKKEDSKYLFEKQKAADGKEYKITTASFADFTQKDADAYLTQLAAAGFQKTDTSDTNQLSYWYDAAGNMVVAGFDGSYFSLTVGTPLA